MKNYLLYICILLNITCFTCDLAQTSQDHWLIIYIHGIIGIQPHLNLPNLTKFFRDKIAESAYQRTVELIRRDEFFYQHHPMQMPGLRKINLNDQRPGSCATAYAHLYEEIYRRYQPQTVNHYYTFGWSGLLSSKMRHYEANILYTQLEQELQEFKKQNIHPKICLITYSHGGNIALKLAEISAKDIYAHQKKISIDKLVCLGLPVLHETDYLINSPLFKKIYHFYSYGDRVQPLDCFSLGCLSSSRTFKSRPDFTVPDKLIQIELRVKKPRSEFELTSHNPERFLTYLNNKRLHRTYSPGHTELWSFGWSHHGYRNASPLYPLPAAILLPYLIHTMDNYHPTHTTLCVEVHPDLNLMKWINRETSQTYYYPFLDTCQFNNLKNIAYLYKPTCFSKKLHDKKIAEYKRQARLEWLNKRNIKRFGGIKVAQAPKC